MGSLILPSTGPVYADALIFIYSVEKHPVYAATLRPLWEAVARGYRPFFRLLALPHE